MQILLCTCASTLVRDENTNLGGFSFSRNSFFLFISRLSFHLSDDVNRKHSPDLDAR